MLCLDERELSWLTIEQIRYLLTKIYLATGSRWVETESQQLRRVEEVKLTFVNTKSGKSRSIRMTCDLFKEIQEQLKQHCSFSFSLSAFRRALEKSGIELPVGQSARVLRYTFASHFVMNGGDILNLQRILGHSTITMTMQY